MIAIDRKEAQHRGESILKEEEGNSSIFVHQLSKDAPLLVMKKLPVDQLLQ